MNFPLRFNISTPLLYHNRILLLHRRIKIDPLRCFIRKGDLQIRSFPIRICYLTNLRFNFNRTITILSPRIKILKNSRFRLKLN
ncbi:hypothetical protein IC575_015499 [Cucumis melo]